MALFYSPSQINPKEEEDSNESEAEGHICRAFAIGVGLIFGAAQGVAYVIAKALTEAAHATIDQTTKPSIPTPKPPVVVAPASPPAKDSPADPYFMPMVIVTFFLIVVGMSLLTRFEDGNKTLKTLGLVFLILGVAGVLLGPFILAILF